jgi:hypothetical protein
VCGYERNTVYAILTELEATGLMRFIRRGQHDPVTRKPLPNVYQVSPAVISLSDTHYPEALTLWAQADGGVLAKSEGGVLAKSDTNQQQEPRTLTNDSIQYQNQQQQPVAPRLEKASASPQTPQSAAIVQSAQPAVQQKAPSVQSANDHTQQRGAPQTTNTSGPRYYQNPSPVYEALEPSGESMSERLRDLGIPLPLARGLVNEYGIGACSLAYDQTMAANAVSKSGFFRHILQKRLTDAQVLQAKQDNKQDKYAEFMNVEAS